MCEQNKTGTSFISGKGEVDVLDQQIKETIQGRHYYLISSLFCPILHMFVWLEIVAIESEQHILCLSVSYLASAQSLIVHLTIET
jgi:hypothetical protein